ncbi:MAG: hypothetical protein EBV82_01570 [Chitinophagia bacterium]|jgi:hypothetical protein|nr:hypothetical protein [Chitinophagia bacterium]
MSKLIFYGLMIYFLYKLIFNIVVPVSDGIKNVRQNMEQRQSSSTTPNASPTPPKKETPKDEEYIDFEEVK